jgi:hypothetical protein
MEELPNDEIRPVKPVRPVLLTVLCVLTFVGSGMNLGSSLLVGIFHDTFVRVATEVLKTLNLPGTEAILEASAIFYFASAAVYLLSLAGAYEMLMLRKRGFHIYTVAQILLIMAPMVFLHLPVPSFFDILLSGLFIILYSSQLKFMT